MGLKDFSNYPEEAIAALGRIVAAHLSPEEIYGEAVKIENELKAVMAEIIKVKDHFLALISFDEPAADDAGGDQAPAGDLPVSETVDASPSETVSETVQEPVSEPSEQVLP